MAVKSLAFSFLWATVAVAVVLINWFSCCILRILKPWQRKSHLALNMLSRWARVADAGKR